MPTSLRAWPFPHSNSCNCHLYQGVHISASPAIPLVQCIFSYIDAAQEHGGGRKMQNGICRWRGWLAVVALASLVSACKQEAEAPPAAARQVRSIVVEKRQAGASVTLTGRI